MEIADLYPYWAREWDAFVTGLREIAEKQRATKAPEDFARIWDWMPAGAKRSINDTLRHIAYVESYIIDKLIMDREPKTILSGSVFAREEYPPSTPAYSSCTTSTRRRRSPTATSNQKT